MSSARRARFIKFAVALVLVIAATETTTALSSQAPSPTAQSGAAQLQVFSRAQTSADALPTSYSGQLQAEFPGQPVVADSRKVTTSNGEAAYLTPDSAGGICFINSNESMCAPSNHSAGAAAVDLCSPTLPLGQMEIEWLLPDGASNISLGLSDGTQDRFSSGYNLYITRLPLDTTHPVPSTINWSSGGQNYSVRTPIPSDASTETCVHPPLSAQASRAQADAQGRRGNVTGPHGQIVTDRTRAPDQPIAIGAPLQPKPNQLLGEALAP